MSGRYWIWESQISENLGQNTQYVHIITLYNPYSKISAFLHSVKFFLMFLRFTSSDALRHTTSWLKSTMEEMMSDSVRGQETGGQGKAGGNVPNPIPILNTALLGILTWDYDKKPLPEVCVAHSINCIIYHQNQNVFVLYFRLWWMMKCACVRFSGSSSSVRWSMRCCS